jgi:hypothetical protein
VPTASGEHRKGAADARGVFHVELSREKRLSLRGAQHRVPGLERGHSNCRDAEDTTCPEHGRSFKGEWRTTHGFWLEHLDRGSSALGTQDFSLRCAKQPLPS